MGREERQGYQMTDEERFAQVHDTRGRDVGDELRQGPCAWVPDASGGGSPPSCWLQRASDRARLAHACAVLRHYAIVAYPAVGPQDSASTRERIRRHLLALFPGADCTYLFWTAEEDTRCLSPDGTLRAPLLVHADGPAIATSARAAFDLVGLIAEPGPEPGTLLVSRG
jgi:hypothetical protein